jgi:hypothetical protein
MGPMLLLRLEGYGDNVGPRGHGTNPRGKGSIALQRYAASTLLVSSIRIAPTACEPYSWLFAALSTLTLSYKSAVVVGYFTGSVHHF